MMKKSRINNLMLVVTVILLALCTKTVSALTVSEQNQFNSLACMRRNNKEWISTSFLNYSYSNKVVTLSLNSDAFKIISNPPNSFRLIRIIEANMSEEPPAYYAMLLTNKKLSDYGIGGVVDYDTPEKIAGFNNNGGVVNQLLTKDSKISININDNKHYYFVFASTSNYQFGDSYNCEFNGVLLKEAPLYIYTEADFYASGQTHKSSGGNYIVTKRAIETVKLDCNNNYEKNSFEAKYCADWKNAIDNNAKIYDFSVKSSSPILYEKYLDEIKKGESNTFKCDPFENVPSKKKDNEYYQSQNTKYLIGNSVNDVVVGNYVFNYGGQFKEGDCYVKGKNGKYVISESCSGAERVTKGSSLIGTSTNPDNIVTTPIVCNVDCTEVVTVQYGAPVASKAGLCFEYKVKVTSRVNCGSKITTVAKPPENEYCDPSASCHYPPPPEPAPGGGGGDCGPDCYGCDVNPHHDLCPNDGPDKEFDECIDKCDGGKYSLSCSNECYNKIYGSSLTKNSYIFGNSTIAKFVANIPRTDLKTPAQCSNAHFSTASNGSVVFLPDGCVAPIYEGLRDDMPCVKDHTNGGGIPCTCSCTLICSWTLPGGCNAKKDYLNEGEYQRDQVKNQAAYDAANKSCSSFTRCSTTQAEFSINVEYSHDKKEEKVYYPYSTNNSSTSKDTVKYLDNGSVSCSNKNGNTVLFPINSAQCYHCGANDQNGNIEYSRTYMMEWGFPGVWINGKSRAISYSPRAGWYKIKNQFCVPAGADNVNELWWNMYHIDDVKNNDAVYSSNDVSSEKTGNTIDYNSCQLPSKDKLEIDYNIKAATKKFGLFGWDINVECFYALNSEFPKYPGGNTCSSDNMKVGNGDYSVRSVALNNLFPDSQGDELTKAEVESTGRAPGFNWTSFATNNKTTDFTSDPKAYRTWVQQKGDSVYSDEYLDYDVTLTKAELRLLRDLKKKMKGFNNVDNVDTMDDGIIAYNSVTNYRSTLFRGNNPILSTFKVPNETVLKCNNIKDETSCFVAGEDQ